MEQTEADGGLRRVWGGLNVLVLTVVLGGGALMTALIVLLGTDHSTTYVDEWASRWAVGAGVGLATALLAGTRDRRYLPWGAAFAVAGALAASWTEASYLGLPLGSVGPLLAASMVLHAWAGPPHRSTHRRRQQRTGVAVTLVVLTVVAAIAVFVTVHSRSTPEYGVMRSDPMASDHLPGLAVRFDYTKDRTTPLGLPSAAQVSRLWLITDGSTRPEKLHELEELASRSGWSRGPDLAWCEWRKTVAGVSLCLVVRPGVGTGDVWVEITQDASAAMP